METNANGNVLGLAALSQTDIERFIIQANLNTLTAIIRPNGLYEKARL